MNKLLLAIIVILLLSGTAAAECIEPTDGMTITQNTALCTRTFDLPSGIYIGADDIELDCDGAILRGNMQGETGIIIDSRKNVRIRECNIVTYKIGIYMKNTTHTAITKSSLLKNRIGARLLDSYENKITQVNDKSTDTPFSVVNSKFNTFLLENKNIDDGFCSNNICNKLANMSFCDDNDFYCSESCSPENDRDCKEITGTPAPQKEKPMPEPEKETIQGTEEKNETPTAMAVQETQPGENKISAGIIILYILAYIITFFALQFYTFTKRY